MHQHLKALHHLFLEETQPFRKVHRMIDLFESIIKTHTVVIMAEYVRQNKLSVAAKGLLSQGLRTPSLGTWQLFSRVLFEELEKDKFAWSLPSFSKEFAELDKALNNAKTNVIALRNGYAHGATPTDDACNTDIQKFDSFLTKLLHSQWLNDSHLEVANGNVLLHAERVSLSLHPLLLFRDERTDASFAFFNDIKNDKIGLLNYPLGIHYREKDFYHDFHEHLPLHEWKKSGNNEFYQRIEELTDTFKGRIAERGRLLQFVVNESKGYCSIQGNPGIGKSALTAQFFKDLRGSKEANNVHVVEYFIRRGTSQAKADYLFNYLIKRTDELFPDGREIRAEGKTVFDLQNQLFSKWRLWHEHAQGKKLLFLIDGLDEGIEDQVPVYMPRENFQNILIIYGSRPGGHKSIDDLWGSLPIEHHRKIELQGLSRQDIRALIYEVANKYEMERESAWIDAVLKRSQGNPLYLKLLCDSIENGEIVLNDIKALPTKIDDYYKTILLRYANDPDGDALLSGLFTFAAAKDYLTISHLGLINLIGSATLMRIGSALKEVLYENPLTEEILDYQLFHESFREYLVKEHAREVTAAQQRIISFCGTWKELEGTWEQRYSLQYYGMHLYESTKFEHVEQLLMLSHNSTFVDHQKRILRNYNSSRSLFQVALLKATAIEQFDEQLYSALQIVDLKYDEQRRASEIISMVSNGEIQIALKRIESLKVQAEDQGAIIMFQLYILCIMELTLLSSRNKPFQRSAIQQLLNHLNEQLPKANYDLDWSYYFPSRLMFQMAYVLESLNLDYQILYSRTKKLDFHWISDCPLINPLQFQLLQSIASGLSDDRKKSLALDEISLELSQLRQVEESASVIQESASLIQESLNAARGISSEFEKANALKEISLQLSKLGRFEESLSVAREIRSLFFFQAEREALKVIADELAKLGQMDESSVAMQQSLTSAACGRDYLFINRALVSVVHELAKNGQIEESLSTARGGFATNDSQLFRSKALRLVAVELAKRSQMDESLIVMQESLTLVREYNDELRMRTNKTEFGTLGSSKALTDIAVSLAKQGQMDASSAVQQEALTIARGIRNKPTKNQALKYIAAELARQGKIEEALSITHEITFRYTDKIHSLMNIATELAKLGHLERSSVVIDESLAIVSEIAYKGDKGESLTVIASELAKQGQMDAASRLLQESLSLARSVGSDGYNNAPNLEAISKELSKQGQIEKSLLVAREISCKYLHSEHAYYRTMGFIATQLAKQGQWVFAEKVISEIPLLRRRISAWAELALAISTQYDFQKGLDQVQFMKTEEAKYFYLLGLVNAMKIENVNADCIRLFLPFISESAKGIEILLQKFAIQSVIFGNAPRELSSQLHHTLNIQWVLDVKSKFPKKQNTYAPRSTENLSEWLHEIQDEDDRDQIELWAKQVAKGKISEEEFEKRLKGIE
jgi:hypothetical protein